MTTKITTANISDDAVTSAKIADDAVGSSALDLAANYAFTGTVTGAGKILQYKTAVDTTRATTASSSWSDVLTLTMTPTDSTSVILMIASGSQGANRDGDQLLSLLRIGRTISGGSFSQLGTASTSYDDTSNVHMHLRYISHPAAAQMNCGFCIQGEDDHNTTSEITYTLQHNMQSSMGQQQTGGVTITLMEIAT